MLKQVHVWGDSLKKISQLYGREEIFKGLYEHNKNFKLDDFYLKDMEVFNNGNAGYIVITPNQIFKGFSFSSENETHEEIMENILYAIYDDYNEACNIYYDNFSNDLYRLLCFHYGVIFGQLLKNGYSLIWAPSKVSSFQYSSFVKLVNDLNRINNIREDNGYPKILIGISICGKSLSIEEALVYYKDNIDDTNYFDEYMMGSEGKVLKN